MRESNKNILNEALTKLNTYEPDEQIWAALNDQLGELPLQKAVKNLPDYQPDETVWDCIEMKYATRKRAFGLKWYAAATILLVSVLGLRFLLPSTGIVVSVSQQKIDSRLQAQPLEETDQQFLTLKAYCESATLVCGRSDFKQLINEYETLQTASIQLQQAIGNYNTEPDLLRQLSDLEQGKAEILNKMAKLV